ncbi:uncharacterized protein LOC144714892 [Wolffia australiana]
MVLRLKPKLGGLPRAALFSSSSATAPPPPPPPSDENGGGRAGSHASLFSEIKARLKQPSPPRRIPRAPPDPPPTQPPPPPAATLDEIRRNLSQFRVNRQSPPPPPQPSFSFQDLYKSSVAEAAGDRDRPSFESIRESLRQLRAPPGPARASHPFELKSLTDRLNLKPSPPLPESIFGRELKNKPESEGEATRKTEFLKTYDFEELGEKLRRLRPGGEARFSLEELNERLARLRELEEKETEYSIGGVSFKDLRESLVKLRDADSKKASMNKFSILASLGGQATPAYMLSPPKEHLVEKYTLPEHLSAAEKLQLRLNQVRDEFKMSESDCGSTRVQVALLTTRIRYLEPILYTKKKGTGSKGKDKHSIKGLLAMVKKRNSLLKYLRRTDWESYCMVLSKLEIRDIEKKEAKGSKGGKGSKEKKRGKRGVGRHSKKPNYA